jgi:hypothetical protein
MTNILTIIVIFFVYTQSNGQSFVLEAVHMSKHHALFMNKGIL